VSDRDAIVIYGVEGGSESNEENMTNCINGIIM